ncbi:hypothetical protein D3C72_1460450 [compost metagenome]
MHEEDFQRRAALTVERQGPGDGFIDGVIQVHLGQHDPRVFRIQAQGRAKTVWAWVEFFQVAGRFVGADKGEHVDLATGHQRADGLAAATIDDVDHPGREAVAEGFEQWPDQQHTKLGRFEHHGVAHDQCRDQGGECLVQRVVVGAHAQRHAQRSATDLTQGVLLELKTAGAAIKFLEGINGVDDVVAGTVELFLRILEVLADFPHQQFDHRIALLTHLAQKGLDMLDPLGHAQGRPSAAALVVSVNSGIQRGEGGVGIEQWRIAEDHLLLGITGLEPYRAAHRRQRAIPALQMAVDQVLALHQRLT